MPATNAERVAVIIRTIVDPNPEPGGPPIRAQPSADYEALHAAAVAAWKRDGIVREIVVMGGGETCTPPITL